MPPKKVNKSNYSVDVGITVTLRSATKRLRAEDQLVLTRGKIERCFKNCRYTLVAELTTNYDLHYHAIASLDLEQNKQKNICKYFKDIFRDEFGYTCIKQITDYNGWCDYLRKDFTKTSEVLYPVLRDDYNIFDLTMFATVVEFT